MTKRNEIPSPSSKLTPSQQRAIALLLEGKSNAAVAAAVAVSTTTLWRWRKLPAFNDAFTEHRRAMIGAVDTALLSMVDLVGDAIHAALTDAEPRNAYLRLQAAKLVLDHAMNADRFDVIDRIAELERKMAGDTLV